MSPAKTEADHDLDNANLSCAFASLTHEFHMRAQSIARAIVLKS